MKIFIASSKESVDLMREIEAWLQEYGHEPLPWDKPGLFPPGEQTFLTLINISKQVDGAICVFGEDDKIWYRGDSALQPRDNILIEFGLFVGTLGPRKAIICRHGTPKHSTDLQGITFIDLNQERRARGRIELNIWASNLGSVPIDPAYLKLSGRIHALEQEKGLLEQRVAFEKEKSTDLEKLLQKENIIDFSTIELEKDGYWKLLFDYTYFEGATEILARNSGTPDGIRSLLYNSNACEIADQIAWHISGSDLTSNARMARKVFRVFRVYFDSGKFLHFINRSPEKIRTSFTELAHSVLSQQKTF